MNWPEKNFSPNNFSPLPNQFYLNDTVDVARGLLGKGLYIKNRTGIFLSQIVEVEAYLEGDPASHAFKGLTQRNQSMFATGGTCYVYLCYGINYCMNVVTGRSGLGEAILLRAAIPLLGIPSMQKNRRSKNLSSLMNGPGKLTQAMGINLKYDGMRFDQSTFKIVDLEMLVPIHQIGHSPRIGISKAKSRDLRFFLKDCGFLSR